MENNSNIKDYFSSITSKFFLNIFFPYAIILSSIVLLLSYPISCKSGKTEGETWESDVLKEIRAGNFCPALYEILRKISSKIKQCIGAELDLSEFTCDSPDIKDIEYAINVSKTVEYVPAEMERVFKDIKSLIEKDCGEFIKRSNQMLITKKIRGMLSVAFRGKLKEGDNCFFDFECSEGLFCGKGTCPSKCEKGKGEGEECTKNEECITGFTCISGKCAPIGEYEGAKCDEDEDCKGEMVCIFGECVIPKQKGSQCQNPYECEYFCDMEKKTCTDIFFSEIGQSCGIGIPDENSDTFCKGGEAYCKVNPEKLTGICTRLLSEGEKCEVGAESVFFPLVSDFLRCGEGLYCSQKYGSICKKIPTEGQECEGICQEGLRCVQGKCITPKKNGETCLRGEECISKNCDRGTCKPKGKSIGDACEKDGECSNLNCRGNICCSPRT